MMNDATRRNKWVSIWVFLMVYLSNDTLVFGTSNITLCTTIGKYFGFIAISVILLAVLFNNLPMQFPMGTLIVVMVMICAIMLTIVFNHERINLYYMVISLIITAWMFCNYISYNEFIHAYLDILYLLAIGSVVVFIIRLVMPNILSALPTVNNYLGYPYKFYLIGAYHTFSEGLRNQSIFREAGVNAVYLCVAIYFELFRVNKIRKMRLLVFVLALITTFSSTGFIIGFLFALIFVLFKNDISFMQKIGFVFLFVALIMITMIYADDLLASSNVITKFQQGTDNGSFRARWASIIGNISFFLSNPITGVGEYRLSNEFESHLLATVGYSESDNTNTFLSFFSAYGLVFGTICFFGWYRAIKDKANTLMTISILVTMFLLYSGENMWHSILFWLICFYGIYDANGRIKEGIEYEYIDD